MNGISNTLTSKNKLFIILFVVLILIALPITIFLASKSQLQDSRSRANLEQDAELLTKNLLSNSGSESDKLTFATQRKEKMLALAIENPDKFLLSVIPEDIRSTLPPIAQDSIEKKVEIDGILFENVEEEDTSNENNKSSNSVILQEIDSEGNSKNTYVVYLREDQEPNLKGRVKINGYLLDNILIPISINNPNENLQTNANIGIPLAVNPTKAVLGVSTTGNLKIGVVMVNFKTDLSDVRPTEFTKETLSTIYFTDPNSVANYLENTSLGNLEVKGGINDVYGWITLKNYTRKQVCDIYEKEIANKGFLKAINLKAKAEATNRGKNFDSYDVIGYVFPTVREEAKNANGTNCNWNAITKGIPGDPIVNPVHFLNGDYDGVNDYDHGALTSASAIKFYSGILSHEVGHSLGLSHANGLTCGDKSIAAYGNCTIYNYGDRFDLIGGAWDYHPHTSASNKNLLGWIPDVNVKKVYKDGEYTLYSASKIRPSQNQLIKISRPTDGGNYYLEYRGKTNGDGSMPSYVYDGALLRLSDVNLPAMKNERGGTQDEWRLKQTYLIDVDKRDNSSRNGLVNPNFKDNLEFIDKRNEITIKQISHDLDSVKLSIKFSPPPCEHANPTLIITEPVLSAKAGEKIRYDLTITNKNSEICGAKIFDLNAIKPSGWTTEFSKNGISLNSSESTTLTVSITSPASATNANNPYIVNIQAVNKSNPDFKRTKEARYNIIAISPAGSTPIPSLSKSPTPTSSPAPTNRTSPTPTPVQTPTPSPTVKPSPSPTTRPSNTPIPTNTISLSPTNGGITTLKFANIKLHGIGNGGDNTNANSQGNPNPITKTKLLIIEIYNTSNALISTAKGNVTFSNGTYSGNVTIDNSINSGDYIIKIKTDKYLKKQIPGVIVMNKGQINLVPSIALTVGDINNDDRISILDYTIITECYSNFSVARNCDNTKKTKADISDDGKVNQDDVNLFLREISAIKGD